MNPSFNLVWQEPSETWNRWLGQWSPATFSKSIDDYGSGPLRAALLSHVRIINVEADPEDQLDEGGLTELVEILAGYAELTIVEEKAEALRIRLLAERLVAANGEGFSDDEWSAARDAFMAATRTTDKDGERVYRQPAPRPPTLDPDAAAAAWME